MEDLFEEIKKKFEQKILQDFDISIIIKPKGQKKVVNRRRPLASRKKSQGITKVKPKVNLVIDGRGRPKSNDVKQRMAEILAVLKSNYPKVMLKPEISEALGITDYDQKQKMNYYLSELYKLRKIEKGLDANKHSTFKYKKE